jgi:short-subunit dehydrogenase
MKKVIVISGGSEGLGKEIAKKLSKTCKVVIISSNKEKLSKTARELGCDFFVCDVTEEEQIESVVANIKKKYKKIDCLINNAAIWIEGKIDENKTELIKKAIAVNVTGVILLTKEVVPIMKAQKGGLIVNIVSQAGLYAKAERSVYSATKWAMTGFTKSLESELSKYHIRVTGLYPGKMDTKMFSNAGVKKDMSDAIDPKELARMIEYILSCGNNIVFPEIGIKMVGN